MMELRNDVMEIAARVSAWNHPAREELVGIVENVREALRFSDPVSRPQLTETEYVLADQIKLLNDQVTLILGINEQTGEAVAEAGKIADCIRITLERRNRELQLLK
ncbi:hypothetical protein [Paenibacillus glufosinatiresistens]|uniref:hypothetical protein n=1 Tax=Paenibacillus glufosinatiresistens TaxID=3070657 RepID=UPI00286DDBC4|nr:hypothetical protein [Paenibacillus sp. YX.27]